MSRPTRPELVPDRGEASVTGESYGVECSGGQRDIQQPHSDDPSALCQKGSFDRAVTETPKVIRPWLPAAQMMRPVCRLMGEIYRDLAYWRRRFFELAEEKTASA